MKKFLIFKECELEESSAVKKYLTTASDGKKCQINHYNLDVIISVGYRVKSVRGARLSEYYEGTGSKGKKIVSWDYRQLFDIFE